MGSTGHPQTLMREKEKQTDIWSNKRLYLTAKPWEIPHTGPVLSQFEWPLGCPDVYLHIWTVGTYHTQGPFYTSVPLSNHKRQEMLLSPCFWASIVLRRKSDRRHRKRNDRHLRSVLPSKAPNTTVPRCWDFIHLSYICIIHTHIVGIYSMYICAYIQECYSFF